MSDILISGADRADELLSALADQLQVRNARYELVVVGGAALLTQGLVTRATRDVDVVVFRSEGVLSTATPLPDDLIAARDRVARDFGLPLDWLNDEPAKLLDFGLPEGFTGRLTTRSYGSSLSVSFASRLDQIHLKLYAMADRGRGKHEQDLRALDPTDEELIAAARWTQTHDPSAGHLEILLEVLAYLGVADADLGPR